MKDRLDKLFARRTFGIKLGLQAETALLQRLGNPEQSYGIIHVAGTNGKGSVCALLESILLAAGIKAGMYTSPHLSKLNERFRVNGSDMTDSELDDLLDQIEDAADYAAKVAGHELTFFECTTAMAFEYFRRKDVQIAVIETGMGGRLDATNVVTPIVSVITRISMEHAMYLGNTLEAIAAEKCGIIKSGIPVVYDGMAEAARGVVMRTAADRRSCLIDAETAVSVRRLSQDLTGQVITVETPNASYGKCRLPLLGTHQIENVGLAVSAMEVLAEAYNVEIDARIIRNGISSVYWPGRFHVVSDDPLLVVDGAHNPGAAEVLAETLRQVVPGKPLGLIVGMCSDKDATGFLRAFRGAVRRLWTVPIRNERCMRPQDIAAAASESGMEAILSDLGGAVQESTAWARETDGAVCITGSLFLVGEILEKMGVR